jgi:hypothetical protein
MPVAQGEIFIRKIEKMPQDVEVHKDVNVKGQSIISHSKQGNHHVLERPVEVFKAETQPRSGLDVFYAILDEANGLVQDAQTPHDRHDFEPGVYEFRIAREFDPFTQQARQVAD